MSCFSRLELLGVEDGIFQFRGEEGKKDKETYFEIINISWRYYEELVNAIKQL